MPSLTGDDGNFSIDIKPMLAATITADNMSSLFSKGDVHLVSQKIDGIRALWHNGQLLTRTFKPIRNKYIQSTVSTLLRNIPNRPIKGFNGVKSRDLVLDGELLVLGENNQLIDFRESQSKIMAEKGDGFNFVYLLFDVVLFFTPAHARNKVLEEFIFDNSFRKAEYIYKAFVYDCPIQMLNKYSVSTTEEYLGYYKEFMEQGFEGIMSNKQDSFYLPKRSTLREASSCKYKEFVDEEAEVIGFTYMRHNTNEVYANEIGNNMRSKKAEGMVRTNMLGTLKVRNARKQEFEVGTGFTMAERENPEYFLGKIITYKFFPYGGNNLPRLPVFKGVREDE
jgi:DNA ligase-1